MCPPLLCFGFVNLFTIKGPFSLKIISENDRTFECICQVFWEIKKKFFYGCDGVKKCKYYRKSEVKVEFWEQKNAGKQGQGSFREDTEYMVVFYENNIQKGVIMAEHLIDIFDENYELIGTEMKSIAHKKGYWHQVFTCVIINSKNNKIYFQKKVPGRYTFERPDYIDITVGGHLKAGETVAEGIREIEEETGFSVDYNELVNLGMRQNTFSGEKKYFAYEYQHLYLLDKDCKLCDFKMDQKEVSGFVEIDIDELLDLLLHKIEVVNGKYAYMRDGEYVEENYGLTLRDVIPSYLKTDQLMLRITIAAKRYCNGEKTEILFW